MNRGPEIVEISDNDIDIETLSLGDYKNTSNGVNSVGTPARSVNFGGGI